jgi:5-methylthioadenosine/S-adenosylhomocysteine deaminase
MAADLLVQGGPLWAGPGLSWPAGAVAIKNGLVTYAGPLADYQPMEPPARVLDSQGGLILPGLVNAHTHGAMTLFRGLADDLSLESWLHDHIFPAEARWVNSEMVELCTLLAAGEMLLGGTTTVCDAYFCMDAAARAYALAGMRAIVCQGIVDFPAPGLPDPDVKMAACQDFLEAWQGRDPLITPGLFAHSCYTCSPATLRETSRLAASLGAPWFIHAAETVHEIAIMRRQYGADPARHLANLGVLEGLKAVVHGVWLDAEEAALLAQAGVGVVACIEAEMKLASGTCDVPGLLAAGLQVGLGTDGAASNNDLSMISELGATSRSAKLDTMDPTALSAAQTLDLALSGSARCLGLEGIVGRLAPGFAADLMVLQAHAPHLTPLFDPASALVNQCRAADVRHVVVAGRQVVKDRQVLSFDLKEVMTRVRKLAKQVATG